MNYIRELNAFIDWLEINPLEAITQTLWFHLMAIANKSGWPEWFTVANLTLQAKLNVSENTLIKHRNLLVQKGRIEYRSQGKQKAGKYRIIPFNPPILTSKNEVNHEVSRCVTSNFAADREVLCEVNLAVNREVNLAALNKLNEMKQNETEKKAAAAHGNPHEFYQQNFGTPSPYIIDSINKWSEELSDVAVIEAMKRALEANTKNWRFVQRILNDWAAQGIKTLEQINAERVQFENQMQRRRVANRSVFQDKLPASVQRQLERERAGQKTESRKAMDDPEFRALLESFPQAKGRR